MHNPVTPSAVSDALVKLGHGAPDAARLATARDAIAQARQSFEASGEARHNVASLLESQSGGSGDTRVEAWVIGTVLASQDTPSTATPVLAAALAMGPRLNVSDDELAAAVSAGTEASARLLAAVDSEEFRARWNVAAALGVVGATLAVARLLELDEVRMRHALGIAATQAAGLAHNANRTMEAIETGKAAADAVEAGLLAKHGFTSAPASIDGRRGLAALMAYRFDATAITAAVDAA